MTATRVAAPAGVEGAAVSKRFLLTTPARLRAGLAVLIAGVVLLGLVTIRSSVRRLDAAQAVETVAAPQLDAAQEVYVSLSDADATVSSAFLRAGNEPPSLQARYRDDIQRATEALPTLARRTGTVTAGRAVKDISEQLPVYTGYIEAARANNRQAFPVGAAYLHTASKLMRGTILPAATTIYEDAAAQLSASDHKGGAAADRVGLAVVAALVLLALAAMLVYLALHTRRVVNVGLVLAALSIVGLLVVPLVAFTREQHQLHDARISGSDPLQVLAAARILTLRSFSDENLELIERGAASEYLPDFEQTKRAMEGSNAEHGLIDTGYLRSPIPDDYARYLAAHDRVTTNAITLGRYQHAVLIATTDEARALSALDRAYQDQIAAANKHLDSKARSARRTLQSTGLAAALLSLLAAVFIVLGLRPRIQEYV